jgi:hypothetical protein
MTACGRSRVPAARVVAMAVAEISEGSSGCAQDIMQMQDVVSALEDQDLITNFNDSWTARR